LENYYNFIKKWVVFYTVTKEDAVKTVYKEHIGTTKICLL